VKRLRAIVSGRVQGVGYRASTADEARRLGVRGWVRNRPDGTVEVDAQGDEPVLERLLVYLRQGPRGARVRTVDVDWLPVAFDSSGSAGSSQLGPFEIR
jgi:acylphosphatase